MTTHSDGSIIVDAEIDAEGFKADSQKLHKAMQGLNTKMRSLGPIFQKAMSGNAKAISSFDMKADTLEGTIAEIQREMSRLGSTQVSTEEYDELCKSVNKAEQALFKLYERRDRMEAIDTSKDSKAWKSLQYDIKAAEDELARYERGKQAMEANGTAFQSGADTAQYAQLSTALSKAKADLASMRSSMIQAKGGIAGLIEAMRTAPTFTERLKTSLLSVVNTAKRIGGTFRGVGTAIKTAVTHPLHSINKGIGSVMSGLGYIGKKGVSAFRMIGSAIKGGITKMRQFSKHSNRASFSMNTLGGRMKMMAMMIKQMLVMRIFMGILTAIGDGFKNLSQYSTQTNKDLSTLKSALTQLKNSFATAFAPILTAVTPVLATLINYLAAAITYVGKFVAALTGAKTFTKATAVQEDYAASLGATGSAAEKAKKQLAGFDELNVLSDSSSDGGGGGGGGASPSEMFEEVPIESSITDFVGKLKEAFKNGDYAGIGEIIGNGINTAVQKVNDFISWDNVGQKITNGVKATAQCFNAIVDTVNWELIGDTFAQGFNTAINTLFLVLTEFDWPGLAAGFARSLNGLVSGIDWGKLGTTLSTGLSTAIATLRSAITTFDWASLGSSISTAINNIDWVGLLSDLAGGISDILKGALDLLIGFAEKLDWGKLGSDLWNGLIGIITNIDWGGIISKAFRLLGAALGGAVSLIVEFCKSLWESLKSGFEATKSYFNTYIEEAGGNVVEGIFKGIGDALKNIGNWIVENIWNPFIEGFKNAFGIHSPSTKMAEMGGYIVEGLLNGIKGVWDKVTGFFSTTFENIKTTISNTWNNIKSGASTAWTNITTSLSTAWTNIKTNASTAWSNLKTTISTGWNNIKTATSTTWTNIKTSLSTTWSNIKSSASTTWTNLKTTVSTGWENIKTATSTKWNTIKSSLSTTWEGIKTTASTKWNNLKSTISTAWDSVKTTATTKWTNIKTSLSTTWSNIKSSASTTWTNLKTTVSTGWENIKTATSTKWNTIKSSLSTTWEGIKTTASTKWNNLKSTISTAWDSVKTTATTKWTNIKASLSTAWEGIKTTASTKWTNLKSTISTAWDNIKTTASSKWESIKTTLSGKWDSIKSTASTKWTNLKSTISTKWTEIKNNASSTWDTVKSTLSSKWDSIKSTASSKWDSIKSTIKNKGWSGVGSDICNGISSGIDSGWSWLKTKVGNVASSLLDKAKSALGIHSPSRLFRDIVGLNIGYGIGEGIEASEGSVVKTVTGLADAIAAEANAGEYNIGGVVSTAEVDGALTGFSDKVANSFSTLLERLQAIADGVTFTVPAMATGTIVPYSVSASTAGGNNVTGAIEASNEELGSVVIQAVTNATTAIVAAIEANSGTVVNLDANSIATSTIKEINRRTRAMGKSPILI